MGNKHYFEGRRLKTQGCENRDERVVIRCGPRGSDSSMEEVIVYKDLDVVQALLPCLQNIRNERDSVGRKIYYFQEDTMELYLRLEKFIRERQPIPG